MEASFGSSQPNPMDDPNIKRVIAGITAGRAELEQQHRRSHPQAAPLTFDVVKGLAARICW